MLLIKDTHRVLLRQKPMRKGKGTHFKVEGIYAELPALFSEIHSEGIHHGTFPNTFPSMSSAMWSYFLRTYGQATVEQTPLYTAVEFSRMNLSVRIAGSWARRRWSPEATTSG